MQLPFISVILPVRNEERYIAACVDSIFSQDYPAEKMEVIFVDGRSEDRTVEMLHAMQKDHPQIVVLDNPNRTVPYAMNIGIAHSSAPVIVRLDAHAEYPADYIRLSVERCSRRTATMRAASLRRTGAASWARPSRRCSKRRWAWATRPTA